MARTFAEVAADLDKAVQDVLAKGTALTNIESQVHKAAEDYKKAKVDAVNLRREMDSLLNSSIGGEQKPKIG